jgi:hypothetical protein
MHPYPTPKWNNVLKSWLMFNCFRNVNELFKLNEQLGQVIMDKSWYEHVIFLNKIQ